MKQCVPIIMFILSINLIWKCTSIPDNIEYESEQKVAPLQGRANILAPAGGNFRDSFEMAFEGIQIKFNLEVTFQIKIYESLMVQEFPVVVYRQNSLVRIFVKKEEIRKYSWNGYCLIALHEWYHLVLAKKGTNEDEHKQMLEDPLYHRWIQEVFGCDEYLAKYFVYIGLEDSDMYKALHESEKKLIEWIKKDYNIMK